METLRTSGLAAPVLDQLRLAWTTRYDAYGDLLYAHLLESILPRKAEILAALHAAATRALSPRDIQVPFWEFTSCYSKVAEERLYEARIGTTSLPLVPVYQVLEYTDVLPRLAATFGADFHVYHRHKETLSTTDQRVQSRREVVLAYYPSGLPPHLATPVLAAHTRHATRLPATPRWGESLVFTDPMHTPPPTPQSSPPRLIPRRCYCEHSEEE